MPWPTALATFFLIWWISLFAVLPWGIRSQHEGQAAASGEGLSDGLGEGLAPGTDPGAPISFRLGRTLLWTTVVAAVVFGCFYTVYNEHWVTIDGLLRPFIGKVSDTYQ